MPHRLVAFNSLSIFVQHKFVLIYRSSPGASQKLTAPWHQFNFSRILGEECQCSLCTSSSLTIKTTPVSSFGIRKKSIASILDLKDPLPQRSQKINKGKDRSRSWSKPYMELFIIRQMSRFEPSQWQWKDSRLPCSFPGAGKMECGGLKSVENTAYFVQKQRINIYLFIPKLSWASLFCLMIEYNESL